MCQVNKTWHLRGTTNIWRVKGWDTFRGLNSQRIILLKRLVVKSPNASGRSSFKGTHVAAQVDVFLCPTWTILQRWEMYFFPTVFKGCSIMMFLTDLHLWWSSSVLTPKWIFFFLKTLWWIQRTSFSPSFLPWLMLTTDIFTALWRSPSCSGQIFQRQVESDWSEFKQCYHSSTVLNWF